MAREQEFYAKVAETLIQKLEEGTAPWQQPWEDIGISFYPMNPSTGKRYKGGNLLYLMAQGRDDPRWMTYRQAERAGAQVRKGEHGTPILYWKFEEGRIKKDEEGKVVLDANGKPVKETVLLERPRAFIHFVFNAEQIEGLPPLIPEKIRTWEPVERAEAILQGSGAKIDFKPVGGAYYSPPHDQIVLPTQAQFKNSMDYYDIALHELGHWTGHESRLNRDILHPFGSMEYAREELRAEISSMMLAGETGLPHNTEGHAAYVGHWISLLKDDPKEIFRAAADAEKIMDYVLSLERKQELEATRMQEVEANQTGERQHEIQSLQQPLERTYLFVPYQDKDSVKELGGKWDRQAGRWYAPKGSELDQFSRWLKQPEEATRVQAQAKEPRRYLAVPYEARREAKAAGALWDSVAKSWYIGPDADMVKLEKWLPGKAEEQVPAISPWEEFGAVLRALGCRVEGEHPLMDGKTHRIDLVDDTRGQKSGFYVAYLDGRPAGYAKNNRTGEEVRWKSSGTLLDQQKTEALQREYMAKKQERAANLAALHEKAAQRVLYQLASLQPVKEPTAYMVAKGIKPQLGAFVGDNGTTCLPVQDADGKLWTMQYIQQDGTKRFIKGGRKDGCFHAVGGTDALRNAPVLVIAEGYATASTLSEALGMPTVAAFDSGNVVSVAKALREKYPDRPMVIAGDDDRHIKPTPEQPHLIANPGRTKAELAAKLAGAQVVFPVFAPGEEGKAFTDFNDMSRCSKLGLEAVKRQLAPVINRAVREKQAELIRDKEQQRGYSR